MSQPRLRLNLAPSVPSRTYAENGICLAPSTHSIAVSLSDALTKPYLQWYLKGWCQGYFHLHHEGVLTRDDFSRALASLSVPTDFPLETSFVDLLKPMCDTLDGIARVMEVCTGLRWWYSAKGSDGNSLVQHLENMDQYVARHTELKLTDM